MNTSSLPGKFFATTRDCDCGRLVAVTKGEIRDVIVELGVLLIEPFCWASGEPDGQELIYLEDFVDDAPLLYDSVEEMHRSLEGGRLKHTLVDCDDIQMRVVSISDSEERR